MRVSHTVKDRRHLLVRQLYVWTVLTGAIIACAAAPTEAALTVDQRLSRLGMPVLKRLKAHFRATGVSYPPTSAVLVGFKSERRLQLFAGPSDTDLRFVTDYYIQGASGTEGPKLRQGDRQVPEGLYRLSGLNPNSQFYLSLRIDYPNDFDRAMARRDQRSDLGGDIYLHGGVESAGCLALRNRDIEELFVLAADMGVENVRIILSPSDLRTADPDLNERSYPPWTRDLYQQIRQALGELPPSR